FDFQDLVNFTRCYLRGATPTSTYRYAHAAVVDNIARVVAERANRSFLVARLVCRSLASSAALSNLPLGADLPSTAEEALEIDLQRRLGANAQRARDLLTSLAYAEGGGLPSEDVWAPITTAITGRSYTDNDVRWLLEAASC